ncbi:hypothetical protein M5689_011436 [Euphorbia peplus]|nr:hypothetical protein M5689_011436 [Euphorbia peplus]
MVRCRRCMLHNYLKIVNICILIYGVFLIIYSLWLNRKWRTYLSHLLPTTTSLAPKPWFIYTCLGVGMAVCFSSLFGSVVSNHFIPTFTLFAYILTIGCLVFAEAAVIDIIFFKMDFAAEIVIDVGEYVDEIESFVKFHVKFARVVLLVALVAQTNVVVVAVMVLIIGIGIEATSRGIESRLSHFTESFLVPISFRLPQLDSSTSTTQACIICGIMQPYHPRRPTIFTNIYALIRSPFQPSDSIY